MPVVTFIYLIPPILLALTLHEFSHALVAFRLGDPTARDAGRLTMNPVVHLDPLGTLMMFIVRFGWARPVPVDARYFSHPARDLALVSAAGPASNLILAWLSGLFFQLFRQGYPGFLPSVWIQSLAVMMLYSLQINVALAFFNLIPIPPLDGSKILYGILPPGRRNIIIVLEQYGPYFLFGLILISNLSGFSLIGRLLSPLIVYFTRLFGGV